MLQETPPTLFQKFRQTRLWEFIEAVLWAGGLAFILVLFVAQAFKIPSGSMLETLQIGDHLLVNKFLYGLKVPFKDAYIVRGKDPQIGDIIVFRYPKDPSLDFIKRIVGVPGDTLEMKNKELYRNGLKVEEPFTRHTQPLIMTPQRDNWGPITIPADEYFVMGDNRDESLDSRFWGTVPRTAIHGKAWIIYWSSNGLSDIKFNRIGKIVE